MKQLPYIEDYIDILGGNFLTWPPKDPVIKLARYDEPIVQSMAEQVNRGLGFTDRQSVLAHKIVVKYRKQWATAGYDVSEHIERGRFKLPIRSVDRTKRISIVDGEIRINFPYDQELISRMRADITTVPGRLQWDSNKHSWVASLIEPRIIWAREFGIKNGFEFAPEFTAVLDSMLDTTDYSIALTKSDHGFTVTNAESSLLEYLYARVDNDNLIGLVDHSAILGYDVDTELREQIISEHSDTKAKLLLERQVNIGFTKDILDFADIVDYAESTNRWPIFVYESGSKKLQKLVAQHFADEDIICSGHHLLMPEHIAGARVVYFTNWKNLDYDMPLLVTMHTLLIGHRRQQVAARAEKIVYYTQLAEPENA